MSALNEVHGRITQRQRQKARTGRSFFSEAKKAAQAESKCEIREGVGLCDDCHLPKWPQKNLGYGFMVCLDCVAEGLKNGGDLQPHELTSPTAFNPYHDRLFAAAIDIGLEPLHERRKGHSRFYVICDAKTWAELQEAAK